jgi:hypothetical protein
MTLKGYKFRELQNSLGIDLEQHIKQRYGDGLSIRELALELKISDDTLYHWVRLLGISRTKAEANKVAWEQGRWNRDEQRQRAYDSGFNKFPLGKPSPRKGRPLGKEWSDKISLGLIGVNSAERHPFWRGGISTKNYSTYWSRNKRLARERANFVCEKCGISEQAIGHKLDVHHIKPFKTFNNPTEANALTNLMAVCRKCHVALEPD